MPWQQGEIPASGTLYVWRHLEGAEKLAVEAVPEGARELPPLRRPLFIMWGFDPDSTGYSVQKIANLINGQDPEFYNQNKRFPLLDGLTQKGYDVCVLIPGDTTDYLQRNAGLLISAMEVVHARDPARSKIPLIGFSAGGVMARMALLLIQRYHNLIHLPSDICPIYVSFDSPHRGANVPLSLQCALHFLVHALPVTAALAAAAVSPVGLGPAAATAALSSPPAAELLRRYGHIMSPAARQLATFHVGLNAQRHRFDAKQDTLRDQLVAEIGDQWPEGVTRCAYANGCPDGVPFLDPGSAILSLGGPAGINFNALPKNWEEGDVFTVGAHGARDIWYYVNKGGQPLDSAPGSISGFHKAIVSAIRGALEDNSLVSSNIYGALLRTLGDIAWPTARASCFVPTTSALNMTVTSPNGTYDVWNTAPIQAGAFVPFDHWAAAPLGCSEPHVAVSEGAAEWVLSLMV
jgi:hypothetical protein